MINGREIRSLTGATRDGAPLALARAPADDLTPWLSWIAVTEVDLPPGHSIRCGALSDQPALRLLYGGVHTVQDREGIKVFRPGRKGMTMLCGSHSRIMPISIEGSFKIINLYLTVGASALGGPTQSELLDRVVDYDALVGHGRLTGRIPLDADPAQKADAIEREFRIFVEKLGARRRSSLTSSFERACLVDPDFRLRDFAASHEVTTRTLERMAKRDFGLTPHFVQRRARALDIAASLLGVALPEDEAAVMLRYYDQAHLIREMRLFFGVPPGALSRESCPMLRMTIESRQKRRLDALRRLGEIEQLPWRDPAAEPAMHPQSGRLLR